MARVTMPGLIDYAAMRAWWQSLSQRRRKQLLWRSGMLVVGSVASILFLPPVLAAVVIILEGYTLFATDWLARRQERRVKR